MTFEEMLSELVEEMHESSTPPEGSFSSKEYHSKRAALDPAQKEAQSEYELKKLLESGRIKRTDRQYKTSEYGKGYYYYFADKEEK
jgi:hypothetical protein